MSRLEFWLLLTGFVDSSRIPMIIHQSSITQTSPRPRNCEGLAPFCRAPPLLALWLGAALARDERAAGNAAAAIPQTSRKEQEFDPARVSGEHTTGNKRAAAAPSVSTSARGARAAA